MTTRTALQDQLDEITANTRKLVQADRLAIGERAVEELFASGIEERILPVGAVAPEFALEDSAGRVVRSRDLLAVGPLVIKFFRGRWCSYCVTELEVWRDLYGQLREQGALLVAISPAIPPRIICFAIPPLPIDLNILLICANCRSS